MLKIIQAVCPTSYPGVTLHTKPPLALFLRICALHKLKVSTNTRNIRT